MIEQADKRRTGCCRNGNPTFTILMFLFNNLSLVLQKYRLQQLREAVTSEKIHVTRNDEVGFHSNHICLCLKEWHQLYTFFVDSCSLAIRY